MYKSLAWLALAGTLAWCSAAHAVDDQTVAKCIYNASPPTAANGNSIALQCDVNGVLQTSGSGGGGGGTVAQGTAAAVGSAWPIKLVQGGALNAVGNPIFVAPGTGATWAVTGTFWQATQPVSQSGTWTVQPGNTANTTAWKVDNSAVTQPISGATASGSSIANAPATIGGRAQNSEATAVSNGQVVNAAFDLAGKQIMMPYANPENIVSGVTAAITDTTSTSTIASAGGSLRNYVTDCMVTNSHATVGTFVKILDGTTIIDEGYAAAAGGGFVRTYPTPRKGTAATAVNCQPVTTGANVICSCGGYKGV